MTSMMADKLVVFHPEGPLIEIDDISLEAVPEGLNAGRLGTCNGSS